MPRRPARTRTRPTTTPVHPSSDGPWKGRWLAAGTLAAALTLSACDTRRPVIPVECRVVPGPAGGAIPVEPDDTLALEVRIDSLDAGGDGFLMLRVDPLAETGVVRFRQPPPPTTVAVGMALTTAGIFEGCVDAAPGGIRIRAPYAPRGRIWLRASADRPVEVTLVSGRGGEPVTDPLTVSPGASGQRAWSADGGTP